MDSLDTLHTVGYMCVLPHNITEALVCLQPYRISFDKVAFGGIFHQCVYVLCHQDPPTMKAGSAAREAFGLDPGSPYMPHLSLLYSDINQNRR